MNKGRRARSQGREEQGEGGKVFREEEVSRGWTGWGGQGLLSTELLSVSLCGLGFRFLNSEMLIN